MTVPGDKADTGIVSRYDPPEPDNLKLEREIKEGLAWLATGAREASVQERVAALEKMVGLLLRQCRS